MFIGKIDIKRLIKPINALRSVYDGSIKFKVSGNGIYAITTDSANIAMVEITIPPESFLSPPPVREKTGLTVDINMLAEVLSEFDKDTNIIMQSEDERLILTTGSVDINFPGATHDSISPRSPKPPKIEFDCTANLHVDDFTQLLRYAEPLGLPYVRLTATDTRDKEPVFTMTFIDPPISHPFLSDTNLTYTRYNVVTEFTGDEMVTATYPTDIMHNFLKTIPGQYVDISFSTDYPCRITSNPHIGATIVALFAPRISRE